MAAGRGLALVPEHWLWLLALIPFAVGIVSLAAAIARGTPRRAAAAAVARARLPGVAALTVMNGAGDLAAYTPFFAATGWAQVAITLAVFAVWVAVWCVAGGLLTRHARVTATISRYSHWILPAAFILIGLYVLHETNAPIRL